MSESQNELVPVGVFMNHIQADLAQGALESAGIECAISADDAGGTWAGGGRIRLLVREEDLRRATEILDTPASTE
jgi:hypothetical protein